MLKSLIDMKGEILKFFSCQSVLLEKSNNFKQLSLIMNRNGLKYGKVASKPYLRHGNEIIKFFNPCSTY
jgi:hypothetical protein